ncbi:M-phase inducer phosphatase 3-like [Octopus sinensis]|uniref:protein-tyrosine-phosphatase n=1 Tax=Octopus sinensis TaxID=2607531 RepID=A0A6P7U0V0_9MOLL|nr:M-phase inducer phosphatase 3-like [Octopus sinensis]
MATVIRGSPPKLSINHNFLTQRTLLDYFGVHKNVVSHSVDKQQSFCRSVVDKLIGDSGKGVLNGGYDVYGRLKTLSTHTMAGLASIHNHMDCHISIFDCRSMPEFVGGHIINAIHVTDSTSLLSLFEHFQTLHSSSPRRFYLFVFYCEYSSLRAPVLARKFLALSQGHYVFLDNVYLLDGGYKLFYEYYKGLCDPPRYVTNTS